MSPGKMCICELDNKTDISKAKEILKDHRCIASDVLADLQTLGTSKAMEEYCKKPIAVVGTDTGFILSSGCTVSAECMYTNFTAMIDTVKNHLPSGW